MKVPLLVEVEARGSDGKEVSVDAETVAGVVARHLLDNPFGVTLPSNEKSTVLNFDKSLVVKFVNVAQQ